MNTLEIILNERDFNFKIFKKIHDGETSEIFLGEFNGRKSIFKLTKRNNFNLLINEYLKNGVIENISKKNVTPNILFYEKKIGLLIYEYIEIESKNKILKNIQSIGEQLKKFHQIKFNKRTKTYKDQFNLYLNKLNSESKNNYLKEAIELFNDLKAHDNENVFSHNDLNVNNILMSKNNIFFIDFEYSSINNKYFDFVRRDYLWSCSIAVPRFDRNNYSLIITEYNNRNNLIITWSGYRRIIYTWICK